MISLNILPLCFSVCLQESRSTSEVQALDVDTFEVGLQSGILAPSSDSRLVHTAHTDTYTDTDTREDGSGRLGGGELGDGVCTCTSRS